LPGSVSPILFIVTGRFVDFYPLRQFAPVIHGNRQARGRIAMGSPAAEECCLLTRIFSMSGKKLNLRICSTDRARGQFGIVKTLSKPALRSLCRKRPVAIISKSPKLIFAQLSPHFTKTTGSGPHRNGQNPSAERLNLTCGIPAG
jgi:hypothetical protein